MVKRRERWICSASEAALGDYDDDDNHIIEQIHGEVYDSDIYIMVKCLFVCMFVTKNHHFLL